MIYRYTGYNRRFISEGHFFGIDRNIAERYFRKLKREFSRDLYEKNFSQ